ncbi:MAG TPA: hypothetical protein VGE39_24335 [Prosthecobacter sp.]
MALRLDTAVIRGEIDNTTRGNVRGKIWLVGHEAPIILDLRGDAWRDVAGCKVTFTNAKPEAQAGTTGLQPKQQGFVGDITASRKVKVPTVPEEEWTAAYKEGRFEEVPTEWRNSLYLEWFSKTNGRVVIESASFVLTVSEWVWEMDSADEEAQKMANMQAMRTWLAGVILRPEPQEDADGDDGFDDSEEAWEDSLKQSDRLNDAYSEALEKYGDEAFDDDRVSFVMGWDHMLSRDGPGSNDDEENDGESWKESAESMPDLTSEELEEIAEEFIDDESPERHPLHKRSYELVLRLLTELKEERAEDPNAKEEEDTALDRFIRNTMNISGKLAGALGTRRFRGPENKGYTLAILRRCLNWANEALAALQELMEEKAWKDRQDVLDEFRAELFALRDGMTDLRKELRED